MGHLLYVIVKVACLLVFALESYLNTKLEVPSLFESKYNQIPFWLNPGGRIPRTPFNH